MRGSAFSTSMMPYCRLVMPSVPVSSRNSDTAIWWARRIMKPGRRYSWSRGCFGNAISCSILRSISRHRPKMQTAPTSRRRRHAHSGWLLPGAVVDGVLVGGAGRHQAPAQRPVVVVVEALARVGHRRCVENTRELEILQADQAAGLGDDIMRELLRGFLNCLGGACLGAEHLGECRSVHLVAGRFAPGR